MFCHIQLSLKEGESETVGAQTGVKSAAGGRHSNGVCGKMGQCVWLLQASPTGQRRGAGHTARRFQQLADTVSPVRSLGQWYGGNQPNSQ